MRKKVSSSKPRRTKVFLAAALMLFALPLVLRGSHTMNWNVVGTAVGGGGGAPFTITATLGFCNGWCTGSAITCCGGLHDVYIRITQISGACAACDDPMGVTVIGPIDAGFVGPPYSLTNPQLPGCPASMGDPGNVEVPFTFDGCPGEIYRVEVLAVNRTTLARCGGLGFIPNVCTNGCRPGVDWALAPPPNGSALDNGSGNWVIPGAAVAPTIMTSGPTSADLNCGDPGGQFEFTYDFVTCRDVPGTQIQYEAVLMNAPACLALTNGSGMTPCGSADDVDPFLTTFTIDYPAYSDNCMDQVIPCGFAVGANTFDVQITIRDNCTGVTAMSTFPVTINVGERPALCLDYSAVMCLDGSTNQMFSNPVVQPNPGSYSIVPAGPVVIDPVSGDLDFSALPCGDPFANYTVTFTPTSPNGCGTSTSFGYAPPPCEGNPIQNGFMCESTLQSDVPTLSIVCQACQDPGATLSVNWYPAAAGGTLQSSGSNFIPTIGTSLAAQGVFDPSIPNSIWTWWAACSCDGCESDRVPVTLQIGETDVIPNTISIFGECRNASDVINGVNIPLGRTFLFPGSSDGGTITASVIEPYSNTANATAAGDGVLIAGAGCFEVTYSLAGADCAMGDAEVSDTVRYGLAPDPFFTIQNEVCYTPDAPVIIDAVPGSPNYDLANPSLLVETWTVLSGPATVDSFGQVTITGGGMVVLELLETFTAPACGNFPAFTCVGTFSQIIMIDDLSEQTAEFTCAPNPVCVDEDVTLTPDMQGGIFSGVNVTDNGDGSGAVFNSPDPGIFQVDYTVNSPKGCVVVSSKNVEVLPIPTIALDADLTICDPGDGHIHLELVKQPGHTEGGEWTIFSGPAGSISGDLLNFDVPGVYVLMYTVGDAIVGGECLASQFVAITILANPMPDFDMPDQICWDGTAGTTVDLTVLSPQLLGTDPLTGMWISTNTGVAMVAGDETGGTLTVVGAGTTTITYMETVGDADDFCTASVSKTITIVDNPTAADAMFVVSDLMLCAQEGDMATLTASNNDPDGVFSGTGVGATTISGGAATATFDATGLDPGEYAVTYTISTDEGCTATMTQNIEVIGLVDPPRFQIPQSPICYTDGAFNITIVDGQGNPLDLTAAYVNASTTDPEITLTKVPSNTVLGNNHDAMVTTIGTAATNPFQLVATQDRIRVVPERLIGQSFELAGLYKLTLTIPASEATGCVDQMVMRELTIYPSMEACFELPDRFCEDGPNITIDVGAENPTFDDLAPDLLGRTRNDMSVWSIITPDGTLIEEDETGLLGAADGDVTIQRAFLGDTYGPGLYTLNHEMGIDICATFCSRTFELVESQDVVIDDAHIECSISASGSIDLESLFDVAATSDNAYGGTWTVTPTANGEIVGQNLLYSGPGCFRVVYTAPDLGFGGACQEPARVGFVRVSQQPQPSFDIQDQICWSDGDVPPAANQQYLPIINSPTYDDAVVRVWSAAGPATIVASTGRLTVTGVGTIVVTMTETINYAACGDTPAGSCSASYQVQIEVEDGTAIDACFDVDDDMLCPGDMTDLDPNTNGGVFTGIGVVDNGLGTGGTFTAPGPGIYAVTYVVNTPNGCTNSCTQNIEVLGPAAPPSIEIPTSPMCYTDGTSSIKFYNADGSVLNLTNAFINGNSTDDPEIIISKVPSGQVSGNNHDAFDAAADFGFSGGGNNIFQVVGGATDALWVIPERLIGDSYQYAGIYEIELVIPESEATGCVEQRVTARFTIYPSMEPCFALPDTLCEDGPNFLINVAEENPTFDDLAADLLGRSRNEMSVWTLITPNGVVVEESDPGITGVGDGDVIIQNALLRNTYGPGLYTLNHEMGIDICATFCSRSFFLLEDQDVVIQDAHIECSISASGSIDLESLFDVNLTTSNAYGGTWSIVSPAVGASIVGQNLVYTAPGCYRVRYDPPNFGAGLALCQNGTVDGFVRVSQQPQPSFDIQDQVCWSDGDPTNHQYDPIINSPTYGAPVTRTWSILAGDATVVPTTGRITVNGPGTIILQLMETISYGACGDIPAGSCSEIYQAQIEVEDGTTQDACFDIDDETLCPGVMTDLDPNTNGGVFTGEGVTDNGLGTGGTFVATAPGIYAVTYTINTPNGCSNSCTRNIEVLAPADAPTIDIPVSPMCYTDGSSNIRFLNPDGSQLNLTAAFIDGDLSDPEIMITKVPNAEVIGNNHQGFDAAADFGFSGANAVFRFAAGSIDAIRVTPERLIGDSYEYAGVYEITLFLPATEATGCVDITTTAQFTIYPSMEPCWELPSVLCEDATTIRIDVDGPNDGLFDALAPDLLDRTRNEMSVWSLITPNGVLVAEGDPGLNTQTDGDVSVVPSTLMSNYGPGLYTLNHEMGIDICATFCSQTFELIVDQDVELVDAHIECASSTSGAVDLSALIDLTTTTTNALGGTWTIFSGPTSGTVAGSNLFYSEAGCYGVRYTPPALPASAAACEAGTADGFVLISEQPQPSFDIQDQVCFSAGDPTNHMYTPEINSPVYDGTADQVWSVTGPATIDAGTGVVTVTGTGAIIVTLTETIDHPACGDTPAGSCMESYSVRIDVEDGTAIDADFTVNIPNPCPGETVTLTPTVNGGVFTGTGVTDNGLGTGATFVAPDCGTWVVTYVLNSPNGCTNSSSQNIETDITDPVLAGLPDDMTVECDGMGNAAELAAWIAMFMPTDNCGIASAEAVLVSTLPLCGNTTTSIYEFIATDDCGNSVSAFRSFSTEDTMAPTISDATDMTVECSGTSQSSDLLGWLNNNGGSTLTMDACGDTVTWSHDFTGGLDVVCMADAGVTVTFTATDACGNQSSTSADFKIEDTEPPVLECPGNIVLECGDPANDAIIESWLNGALAIDACLGTVTVTNDFDALATGDCGGTGVTTVTFTATDDCMNEITCPATITIADNTAPSIDLEASDLMLPCADPGNQDEIDDWIEANGGAIASDLCSEPLMWEEEIVEIIDECGATSTTLYVFRVTDICGNVDSTMASVILFDEIDPVLILPPDTIVDCDNPDITVEEWIMLASGTDECGFDTVTAMLNNTTGGCAGGIMEYIFTAIDSCGNETTGAATYSTQDTSAPEPICPPDLVLECDDLNNPTLVATWLLSATATDNCSDLTFSNNFDGSLPALSCDGSGLTTVTFYATDACGNIDSCMSTITIDDTQAPVFENCPDDITVLVNSDVCTNNVVYSTPVVFDMCDDTVDVVLTTGIASGMEFPLGETMITFTATDDCDNSSICTFTITVVDSILPSLSCPSNDVVVCADEDACTWMSDGSIDPTFRDNCMGDSISVSVSGTTTIAAMEGTLPAGTVLNLGRSTITYLLEDTAGTIVTCSFDVVVEDCQAPVIFCPNDTIVECDGAGNLANLATWVARATAMDNCMGLMEVDTMLFNTISGCGNTEELIYAFSVADTAGNVSVCYASFQIIDETAPVITDAEDITLECTGSSLSSDLLGWLNDNGGATLTSDACSDTVVWTHDFTGGLTTVCEDDAGVTVTFTATDPCGNQSTTSAVFKIEDTTQPDLTCPEPIVLECADPANQAIIESWLNGALAIDACEGTVPVTNDFVMLATGACGNTGVTTVIFTATDACENEITCTQTITIVDNTAPTIIMPANDLRLPCADAGNPAAIAAWLAANGEANATDLCSEPLTWENDVVEVIGQCGATSTTVYVFRVTDDCDNVDSTMASVILFDEIDPMLVLPPDTIVDCENPEISVEDWILLASGTDECGFDTVTAMLNNTTGGCAGGVMEYIFTAVDSCGNETTGIATYGTQDTSAPEPICPDPLVLECDDLNNPTLIAAWLQSATATDNCSDVTFDNNFDGSLPALSCDGSVVTTVTFYATDACGNVDSCMSTITIDDTQAPVFENCPDDITVLVNSDVCTNNVVYSTPVVFDMCDDTVDVELTAGIPSGMEFPLGETMITFTATDDCDNSSICTFTITVVDSILPSLSCPSNDVVVCADEEVCTWMSDGSIDPTFRDNCMGDSISVAVIGTTTIAAMEGTLPAGTIFNLGRSTITYILEDTAGTIVSCSFEVVVEDCQAPEIFCPSDTIVECDGAGNLADVATWMARATAMDNCMGLMEVETMLFNTISGCGNTEELIYQFSVADTAGNVSSCFASFQIIDETAPVITDAMDITLECTGSSLSSELLGWLNNNGGATLTSDACGDTVVWTHDFTGGVQSVCMEDAGVTVTFTATDPCGNQSTTSAVFKIQDTAQPVLTCPDPIVLECADPANDAIIESWLNGALAIDACEGTVPVTNNYSVLDMSGCGNTGITTVTFTATDACMNEITCTQTITILDRTAPVVIPAEDLILPCADAGNPAAIIAWLGTNGGASATDLCSDPIIPDNALVEVIDECGATSTTTYVFRFTDACGNVDSTLADVILIDTTAPVLVVPNDTIVDCSPAADLTAWFATAVGTDECGFDEISVLLFNSISGCGGAGGTNVYEFTAVDSCGNETVGYAEVMTQDTVAPVLTCAEDLVLECGNPNNDTRIIQWLQSTTATDNCDSVAITNDYVGGLPANLCNDPEAEIVVTFTGTDGCGNSTTCTATITMDDTQAPVFENCPDSMVVNIDVDLCEANVVYSTPIAEDLCDDTVSVVLTTGIASGMPFPLGDTEIIFTATDDCGNSSTCRFVITVLDSELPSLSCPSNEVVVCNDDMTCSWLSDDRIDPTFADNCMGDSLSVEVTGATMVAPMEGVLPPTIFGLGRSTITYILQDTAGNIATCSFDVLVEDCEAPVIVCPLDTVVDCDGAGNVAELATWLSTVSATDNCMSEITIDTMIFNTIPECGMTSTVVYQFTASDTSGNMSSCFATFAIQDTTAPVAVCCDDFVVKLNSQGVGTITVDSINCGSFDECSAVEDLIVTIDRNEFTEADIGMNPVVLTVTDECGNSDTCTVMVMVMDARALGVAKRLVETPTQNPDGSYTVQFEFNVENLGNTTFGEVQVTDNLAVAFPAPCMIEKQNITSSGLTVNESFDGVTDFNLLNGTDTIAPGDIHAILLEITIDSCGTSGPFENFAVVSGLGPDGVTAIDTSTTGADPDPNGDGSPAENDPTIIVFPGIAVVKTLNTTTAPPELQHNGNYKLTFDFVVTNTGLDTLTELHLLDDFQNQFGCAFQANISGPEITDIDVLANGGSLPDTAGHFTGSLPAADMLDGTGTLPPGTSFMVSVCVEVDPDCPGVPEPLKNQATATAMDENGDVVQDLSDESDLGGNDPTKIVLPSVGVSKEIVSIEPAMTDGNFIVTYLIRVQNTGNVQLSDIELEDEVVPNLAPAAIAGTAVVVPGSLTGAVNALGAINPAFDGNGPLTPGVIDGADVLDGTSVLDPGEILDVQISLEINVGLIPFPDTLFNSAIAYGADPDMITVQDSSENGNNPDGSDVNGDWDVNTPTPLSGVPSIAISKEAIRWSDAGEINDGNVVIAFEYVIVNNGTSVLEQIQLTEDFSSNANLGDAFFQVYPDSTLLTYCPGAVGGGTVPSINSAYDGAPNDVIVFTGLDGELFPGDSLKVELVIEVDPNAPGTMLPLMNLATASGVADQIAVSDDSYPAPDVEGGDSAITVNAPAIGLLKQVADIVEVAGDNFEVTYKYTIKNEGTDTLTNITLRDSLLINLGNAYMGLTGPAPNPEVLASPAAVMNPTTNGGFDGDADVNVLSGADGILAPEESVCVLVTVLVDPDADTPPPPLTNQAYATGDAGAKTVEDISDNGATDGGDTPTPLGLGGLNLTKEIKGIQIPAASGIPGNADVTFKLRIMNGGNTDLMDLMLFDDVVNQFGPAYVGVTSAPEIADASDDVVAPTPGAFPAEIFSGGGLLMPGDSFCVLFTIEVDPNAGGAPVPIPNLAVVKATDPFGFEAIDTSDAGNGVGSNPDHPDDLGTESDPVLVYVPSIGAAKKILNVQTPQAGVHPTPVRPGLIEVVYQVAIKNTGNTDLDSIQICDTISTQFGLGFNQIVPNSVTYVDSLTTATVDPVIDPTFNGTDISPCLFDGISGILLPNEELVLTFVVEIDANLADEDLTNQLTAFGNARRPMDAPASPGAAIVICDTVEVDASDLSDCGFDPESINADDPFDLGTGDDPTVLQNCWGNNCDVTCISHLEKSFGPDCRIEIDPTISTFLDPLCVSLGFFEAEVTGPTGAIVPGGVITPDILGAKNGGPFTICITNIVCPEFFCCTELTIRNVKAPRFVSAIDTTVYCTDPFLSLSVDDPAYPKPVIQPPCEGGTVDGPIFGFEWVEADFPCGSPFAKIVYREWKAFGANGEEATIFDRIYVKKLPQLAATDIWCPASDTIYCNDPAESCADGVRIIVPAAHNPLIRDTLCLTEDVLFDSKCFIQIAVEVEQFEGSCPTIAKKSLELKQSCYDPLTMAIPAPDASGVTMVSDGYFECEYWLTELDTTPPMLVCGPRYDTIPTNDHDCLADIWIPSVEASDLCGDIDGVKARIPALNLSVLMTAVENNRFEHQDGKVTIPHGQEVMIVYEALDECHNRGFDTCFVFVKDLTPPVVVVDKGTNVTLSDKKVWIPATSLDEGSSDNCGINLLLARRTDWQEAGVDLCHTIAAGEECRDLDAQMADASEWIWTDGHDTLWCLNLDTDKNCNEIEAHYAQQLEWLAADGRDCGFMVWNAWQYDLIVHATKVCAGHDFYTNEFLDDLIKKALTNSAAEYQDRGLLDKFKCPGDGIVADPDATTYQEKCNISIGKANDLIDNYKNIGGGWSDAVPALCADACSEITVELLVVDFWCNWATGWETVRIEDKSQPVIAQELTDIAVSCQTFRASNLDQVIEQASNGDATALAQLDDVFGTYKKVWRNPYGNLVDIAGEPIDDLLTYEDSDCACGTFARDVQVFDEYLGYVWKTIEYDSCWYVDRETEVRCGLVEANCAGGLQCAQDVWYELDACSEGYVYRKFKIWNECLSGLDHATDTVTRIQRIEVRNNCPLHEGMFDVPKQLKVDACGIVYDDRGNAAGPLHPDETGWVDYTFDDDCRLVGIAYEDRAFTIVGGDLACHKVIRTWYMMEWCDGVPTGDWWRSPDNQADVLTYEQEILVQDTIAPLCEIDEIGVAGVVEIGGCSIDLPITMAVSDACGINRYEWQLDSKGEVVGSGSAELTENMANVTEVEIVLDDLVAGDYTLKVVIVDECNNESGCTETFTVSAVQKPVAICVTSITATLSPVDLDNDQQIDSAWAVVWADEFDSSSEPACGTSDPLEFRVELLDGVNDDTWVEDTTFIRVDCNTLGTIQVRMWVIDPSGSADFCDVFLEVQDPNEICEEIGQTNRLVNGYVATELGRPIDEVTIDVRRSDGFSTNNLTGGDGAFAIPVPGGLGLEVTAKKDGDDRNGISTSDLILLQKHLVGVKDLPTGSARKAADVNNDGKVSPLDLVTLRKLVLGVVTELPQSDSWRFYNLDDDNTTAVLAAVVQDEEVEFMGVKIGDINMDSDPTVSAARGAGELSIVAPDLQMASGSKYRVDFRASDFTDIAGLQFTLQTDLSMTVRAILPNRDLGLQMKHFGEFQEEGSVTFSWHAPVERELITGLDVKEDQVLFSLIVEAQDDVHLRDHLALSGEITRAEAYRIDDQVVDVSLTYISDREDDQFALYQNRPNPFENETVIGFNLPQAEPATITIYDVAGRLIETIEGDYLKGYNEVVVQKLEAFHGGILYYQLDTKAHTAARRMILIK